MSFGRGRSSMPANNIIPRKYVASPRSTWGSRRRRGLMSHTLLRAEKTFGKYPLCPLWARALRCRRSLINNRFRIPAATKHQTIAIRLLDQAREPLEYARCTMRSYLRVVRTDPSAQHPSVGLTTASVWRKPAYPARPSPGCPLAAAHPACGQATQTVDGQWVEERVHRRPLCPATLRCRW